MTVDKNKSYIEKFPIEQEWYMVDATNQNLGRLSSQIAYKLRGKKENTYTPHMNNNIHIIIINSKLINITGNKDKQKKYIRHSGRPGSLKVEIFEKLQQRIPNRILEKAIKGMLPKNALGRKLFKQLKIYSHNIHPHSSQKPTLLKLN